MQSHHFAWTILIIGLGSVVIGMAIGIGSAFNAWQAQQCSCLENVRITVPVRPLAPPRVNNGKPELGMRVSEVTNICGDWLRSSRYQSGNVDRFTAFYPATSNNIEKGCNGYFVFEDLVLVSTYKN